MLRIAITAAGLVLATGAMANGPTMGTVSGGLGTTTNPIAVGGGFYVPTKCPHGWTLVDVASTVSVAGAAPTIHKCAAVGDLRDPE